MVHIESEGFRPVFDTPDSAECSELLPICPGYQVNDNERSGTRAKQSEADHEFGATLEIWEGWASDENLRFRGSSGGVLSALSLYCLEIEQFAGVLHAGMDPAKPWMNRNHVSRDRAAIIERTGSRYAPSSPCAGLRDVRADDGLFVFVGKPCDVSAVKELCQRDPGLDAQLGLVLTFFCAGTPSTRGTLDLIDELGADRNALDEVHYRGSGWPGRFRTMSNGQQGPRSLTYEESWGKLTGYRPLRCNLCPDGLGRLADIACGDAWDKFENNDDPGRSLVLVRTERGREFLQRAQRAGYVTLKRVGAENVLDAQRNLLARRRELFGRLTAFRLLGVPVPSYVGFSLMDGWRRIGTKRQVQTIVGTFVRILKRGWFKKRRSWSASEVEAASV